MVFFVFHKAYGISDCCRLYCSTSPVEVLARAGGHLFMLPGLFFSWFCLVLSIVDIFPVLPIVRGFYFLFLA